MDRRKKLVNYSESQGLRLLDAVSQRHGARVFTKVRVADALEIDNSGISKEQFSYALLSHFDFVVSIGADPQFAVEFDGPAHGSVSARSKDRMKNEICERLGMPLARINSEHLFTGARDLDYLTWLAHIYFAARAISEAQEAGGIPGDGPVDPMDFLTWDDLSGRFPLFVSAHARTRMLKASMGSPSVIYGDDDTGRTQVLAYLSTPRGVAFTTSEIYLRGLGIAPSHAAEEVAVVKLDKLLHNDSWPPPGDDTRAVFHRTLVEFLRQHHRVAPSTMGGGTADLGFTLRWGMSGGKESWEVGPYRGASGFRSEA